MLYCTVVLITLESYRANSEADFIHPPSDFIHPSSGPGTPPLTVGMGNNNHHHSNINSNGIMSRFGDSGVPQGQCNMQKLDLRNYNMM